LTPTLFPTRRSSDLFLEKGADRVSPFMVPMLMPNAAAGNVAMAFGFTGPNECITTACAAGAHAVGEAYRIIKNGLADVCIAGGKIGRASCRETEAGS